MTGFGSLEEVGLVVALWLVVVADKRQLATRRRFRVQLTRSILGQGQTVWSHEDQEIQASECVN